MELKRVENSKQRLHEKMVEGKKYLEKEVYDVNELVRLKTHLEKKKTQFEKDIEVYLKVSDKDDDKINDYEILKIEAEDIFDDLQHYINFKKNQMEAEEKKRQIEAEEKEKERQMVVEEKTRERNQELERLRFEKEMEETRLRAKMEENIQLERIKLERLKLEGEIKRHEAEKEETNSKKAVNENIAISRPRQLQ